jgi:hypothetical protein
VGFSLKILDSKLQVFGPTTSTGPIDQTYHCQEPPTSHEHHHHHDKKLQMSLHDCMFGIDCSVDEESCWIRFCTVSSATTTSTSVGVVAQQQQQSNLCSG